MFRFLRKDPINILRYLPKELPKDSLFKNTADICSTQHKKHRIRLTNMAKQLFVETATWGLDDWERVLAIPTVKIDNFAARRNRILLKLQGCQTSTVDFMNQLINRYIEDSSGKIVEHNEESAFCIEATGGSILDFVGLLEAVDTYKPAHLAYWLTLKRKIKQNIYYATYQASGKKIAIGIASVPLSQKIQKDISIAIVQRAGRKIAIHPAKFSLNQIAAEPIQYGLYQAAGKKISILPAINFNGITATANNSSGVICRTAKKITIKAVL